MNRLIKAVVLFALLLPLTAMAQTEKKSFTLDDLMWGGSNYWNLQPANCLLYTSDAADEL